MSAQPSRILLVANDKDAIRIIRKALRQKHPRFDLVVAPLPTRTNWPDEYCNAGEIDLILLDPNPPTEESFKTLIRIRSDPNLASLPVIVLTVPDTEADLFKWCAGLASCYLRKSGDPREFVRMLRHVLDLWINVEAIPSQPLSDSMLLSNCPKL